MFERKMNIAGREFLLQSKAEPKWLEFKEAGALEYELSVDMGGAKEVLSIKWTNHMVGLLSYWNPCADRERYMKQWFRPRTNQSNMYYGAPVFAVIEQGDVNFSTVAVSDAVHPIRMTFCVNDFEEKENLDFHVYLFEGWGVEGTYTLRIRIDERKIPYYDTIPQVTKWWENFYPSEKMVPESAQYPLYSTWYNYHQHPTQESLEAEMSEAVKYGMRAVIIDDGWSYDGNGTSDYFDCGDWAVAKSKFPDFKGFMDKLHEMGVKGAVWFPVSFLGYNTKDYQRFQGKMLYNTDLYRAGVVDPRYPEVRKYLVDTYVDMVNQYGLDGLKLDFIDSFKCGEDALICTDKSVEYDCEEVEEGVIRLLREIREALTAEKEDFMIEFRQHYVGPAIVRDANMLRVMDCAFDVMTNRIAIVDLRLMDYDIAVHADMLLWAQDESPVNCAKMLQNIMFGVPQISVLIQNSTEEQKAVLGQYIAYWEANRDAILWGTLKAEAPESGYTFVSSESDTLRVAVAYTKNEVSFDGKATDVFNATAKDYLYVENSSGQDAEAEVFDCFGEQVAVLSIKPGVFKVQVPEGGMIKIR